jgi:hypothetical protein
MDHPEPAPGQTPTSSLVEAAAYILRQCVIKVLIFGPGPSGGDIYVKRCELRTKITDLGHEAHFCEDIWNPKALQASGLNLGVAEFITLRGYDYIVCLMASPGSIGEVHDFARNPEFAVKMMVCVNQSHKDGYSANSVLRVFEGCNGKLDWFNYPSDITDCHLATRVLEQIRRVSEFKQWEIASGGFLA